MDYYKILENFKEKLKGITIKEELETRFKHLTSAKFYLLCSNIDFEEDFHTFLDLCVLAINERYKELTGEYIKYGS